MHSENNAKPRSNRYVNKSEVILTVKMIYSVYAEKCVVRSYQGVIPPGLAVHFC